MQAIKQSIYLSIYLSMYISIYIYTCYNSHELHVITCYTYNWTVPDLSSQSIFISAYLQGSVLRIKG